MADSFSIPGLDFTSAGNAADELSKAVNQLFPAESAVSAERKNYATTEQEVAAERLRIAQLRNQQVQVNTAQSSSVLDQMQSDLQRSREINDNLFLQVIEPVAGIFDAKYSREKLGERIKSGQTQLTLLNARDQMQAENANALNAQGDAKLKDAESKFNVVAGVADDIAKHISSITQVGSALDASKIRLLNSTDTSALPGLIGKNGITKQDVDNAIRVRTNEQLDAVNKQISTELNGIQLKRVQLENMTDEALAGSTTIAKYGAESVKNEQLRRAQRNIALSSAAVADRDSRRAELIATKSPEELAKIAADPKDPNAGLITPEVIELAKQGKQKANDAAVAAQLERIEKLHQLSTAFPKFMSRDERDGFLTEMERTGKTTIKTPEGLTITKADLTAANDIDDKAAFEHATTRAAAGGASIAALGSVESLARSAGIDPDEATKGITDPVQKLDAIMKGLVSSNALSPEVRAGLQTASGHLHIATASNSTDSPDARIKSFVAMGDVISKASEQAVKDATSHLPDPLKQPATDFMKFGKIKDPTSALNAVAYSAAAGGGTGSPIYDAIVTQAGKIARDELKANKNSLAGLSLDSNTTALLSSLAGTKIDPKVVTQAVSTLGNPETQLKLLQPFTNGVVQESYARLLESLGLNREAEGIRNGDPAFTTLDRATGKTTLDDRKILAFLGAQKDVNMYDVSLKLKQAAAQYGYELDHPTGTNGYIQSAVNTLLFGGDTAQSRAFNLMQARFKTSLDTYRKAQALAAQPRSDGGHQMHDVYPSN